MRIPARLIDIASSQKLDMEGKPIINVKGVKVLKGYTEDNIPSGYMTILDTGNWAFKSPDTGEIQYLIAASALAKGVIQEIYNLSIPGGNVTTTFNINHTLEKMPSDIVVWNNTTGKKVRDVEVGLNLSFLTSKVTIQFDTAPSGPSSYSVHVIRYESTTNINGSGAIPRIFTAADIGGSVTLDGNHWIIASPDNPRPLVTIQKVIGESIYSVVNQEVQFDTSGPYTLIVIPFEDDVTEEGIEVSVLL